ncbi:MAG TPA: hypothetical protein VMD48_04665 [Solirubrobacteraceae bacterium]|nr:hypothetical protein [Solirubrobacteraceae bacterium]
MAVGRCSLAAVAAVGVLVLPGSALARTETVRLTIHSTTRVGAVTVRNGSSSALEGASVAMTMSSSGGATFELTSADGKTLYTLGVPSFLRSGGTWLLSGSVVGSGANTVALALYPEGPGAGKAGAHAGAGDYARIVIFNEKHDRTTGTLGTGYAPIAVGHTTFGVAQFFGSSRCQLTVFGPQFKPAKLFGATAASGGNLIASPNGKQAFVVVASNFRG